MYVFIKISLVKQNYFKMRNVREILEKYQRNHAQIKGEINDKSSINDVYV